MGFGIATSMKVSRFPSIQLLLKQGCAEKETLRLHQPHSVVIWHVIVVDFQPNPLCYVFAQWQSSHHLDVYRICS